MKKKILLNILGSFFFKVSNYFNSKWILTFIMIIGISSMGYAQKGKGNGKGNNKDIIPVVTCVKDLRNGLYQASFAYENPTNDEVTIDENGSIIKSNKGKKVAKGLNKFKPGTEKKVFTKEFGPGDYVEWTIISNGNTHTVIANANSSKCAVDDGFIEPVIGNGKSFDIIGQELTSLCDEPALIPSDLIFQIKAEKVLIEIVPVDNIDPFYDQEIDDVITLLQGPPFNVPTSDFLLDLNDYNNLSAVDVYVAKADLCLLNDYPLIINFARPVYPAIKHSFGDISTGNAVSQGDASQGSDVVRESFRLIDAVGNVLPVDGKGITIGVMSNSYGTQTSSENNLTRATIDVQQGDLPGDNNPNGYLTNVDVLKEYPYDVLGPASDEGRAMMHIIHDVAPGAALAFHTGSLSPRNFEVGFKALAGFNKSNEVIDTDLGLKSNIIVDDITFITEPFFTDGRISASINAFSTAGGIHFTSAGNFADNGYQSTFSASSTVPNTNFIDPGSETKAHLFDGTGDYLQKFSVVPGTYLIALQWKELVASQDYSDGADSDLDIYIVDDLGRLLVGSNRVNSDFVNSDGTVDGIKGDPTEIIVFRATGTGEANILITSANGATNVPFRYIAFQSDGLTLMEYDEGTPTPTISGHAMTEASVTVGAIRYNKTEPESFSSYGGTLSDNITSVEVDFAAPDGVDTNVISIGSKYFSNGVPVDDTPLYPNFFGTSASAPSAAAAVALLQSALPTWYPDVLNPGKSSKSANEVIQLFKDNIRDGSLAKDSLQAGTGMIDANKVFNSLAAQTGRITSFEFIPETASDSASIATVQIKIIGEFLPVPVDGQTYETDPLVYLDGEPVPYTLVDGVIYAEIPPFSGNPVLQIYTKPKEGSAGNGGFSEPYSFFQDGKTVLKVTANPPDTINEDGSITQNPVTVKFGEEYKSKLTYTVEGLKLLADETYPQALSRLGFPIVGLSTVVDNSDYPDVKNYTVTPNFEGDFPDSDIDGIADVYDQCPDTPEGANVDENGCSDAQKGVDNFTPATTYKVNFKNGDLVIEKNNLIITPKDEIAATYGEKITVELEYSGYGTTNDDGVENFDLINNLEVFLAKIKEEHIKDFYNDETTGITPVGIINNFKPGTALDAAGVDRYQDILDLLENGSWISSENTFINRVEEVPYSGGSYPENAGYPERVYGSVNTDLGTGYINFNPLDFTAYLDYFDTPDEPIENGQVLGIINGQRLGVINGQRLGIINGQVLGVINGQVLGVINGQRLGVVNGQVLGVVNGQRLGVINDSALGSGTDTNDYDQVFSIIDTSDFSQECLDDDDGACGISTFYAINLITGVEVTNGVAQYIFPGTFINSMSDNFNITYQKAELAVAKKDLTVSIPDFEIEYGDALTKDRLLEETTVFEGWAYGEDIATYFAEDEQPFEFIKEGITYKINELKDLGDYTIKLNRDLENYNIGYPGGDYGTLKITVAPLTFDTQTLEIKYGETPVIAPNFIGFADSNDEDPTNDETEDVLKVDGKLPYYFMKDGDDTKYEIGDKMNVGDYNIFITDVETDNYEISPNNNLGTLKITVAPLTFDTQTLEVKYGETPVIAPNFVGFADSNNETATVLEIDGKMPYYFMTDGDATEYKIGDTMDVGDYNIFITDDVTDNYTFSPDTKLGTLTIAPATLTFDTQTLTVNYGETPVIAPNFVGFADSNDETATVLEIDGKMPYYFMKDGDATEYTIGGPINMDAGDYDIFITDDLTDNYTFSPGTKLGTLSIASANLTFDNQTLTINYGETPVIAPNFVGFADSNDETATILEIDGKMPYYFMKDGDATEYTIGGPINMDAGDYDIFITDDLTDNYTFSPDTKLGALTIEKTTLEVEISPDELIVNQGDIPQFTSIITGYVNGETEDDVFPGGISYYFVDDYGVEQSSADIGVFTVKIREESQNYLIQYVSEGKLYINPYGTQIKKIRNYLDCIVYSPNDPSGFDYIAKFSYENPNNNTLYVLPGVDNNISGDALYSGELPFVFLPGEGSFEILFDGNLLKWNLTTFESTHKTSTSASANSDSGKCSGGTAVGDPSYTIFPNPVQTVLTIQQNVSENSDVDIYNLNGVLKYHNRFNKNGSKIKYVDMTSYLNGSYFVKITTNKDEKVYNIIKQ